MFAEVAFPISGYQTFIYSIPQNLRDTVQIGSRVKAPFGPRLAQGIIVKISESTSFQGTTKDLIGCVDDIIIMTPELWSLIEWISDYYVTPIGQVAKSVLPKNLSTRYKPQKIWYVRPASRIDTQTIELVKKRAPKQYNVFNKILNTSSAIKVSSLKALSANPLNTCRELEKRDLVKLFEKIKLSTIGGLTFDPIHKKVSFNADQKYAVKSLLDSLNKEIFLPFLLHGVTGSGKTEIYIEAVQHCLKINKTAIILLPEISLTPQIAGRFRAVFGDTIALWHSKLTVAQRSWTWKQICLGTYKVVIGARSAVFAPLKNIGLIVVDEEQEASFRQESPAPRYHARDVALMRAKLERAVVVLASATPSLETYYNYKSKKIKYLHLPERFGNATYPQIHLVDMLTDQEDSGKYGQIISGLLQDKIEERLNKKEQIILLQNRRGFSPVIKCGDCGEITMCTQCQIALTYHKKDEQLICHSCGYIENEKRTNCSECTSNNLKYFGTGTQKVESLIKKTFPNARISRLDADTSKVNTNLTNILKMFSAGEIDILLGTQMIAKGLDFPNATLVGIINADLGLQLPDFRAGERTFQLIYQASGRAGRRDKPGEVVIQTYLPENTVIKHAANSDMLNFYKIMLDERNELNYPPFSWITKIEFTGENFSSVSSFADKISKSLKGHYKGLEILGPAPCYLEKIRNQYRVQIVFKSKKKVDPNGKKIHKFILSNFQNSQRRYNAGGTRINIHIDPLSLI